MNAVKAGISIHILEAQIYRLPCCKKIPNQRGFQVVW